jgi:hypothetical protein
VRFLFFGAGLIFMLSGCASLEKDSAISGDELLPAVSDREISPEERAFLVRYTDTLRYCVYFNETSGEDPLLKEEAVRTAFELAREKNAVDSPADVYIEIDALTEGESREDNHYGSGEVKCVLREARSGTVLGVLRAYAPRTFSKASQFDAKANALRSVLREMVPEAIEQTKSFMLESYKVGFPYELTVGRIRDARQAAEFRKALALRVRSLGLVSDSSGETRYSLTFFGPPEDVKKAVYEAAAGVPGLEEIKSVKVSRWVNIGY